MRDKGKPPSKGLTSLSDKLKSLQTLIDNSKDKNELGDDDANKTGLGTQSADQHTEASHVDEDASTFDWQNIELTSELGTDFRASLTGVVPLREGSIAPELDSEDSDLVHDDIPTLETIVYTPPPPGTYPKQTISAPPSADSDEVFKFDSKHEQDGGPELSSSDNENLADDLSIPTLTDSVFPDQAVETPSLTPTSSDDSTSTNGNYIHPISDKTAGAEATTAHTVEFVGKQTTRLRPHESSDVEQTLDRPPAPLPSFPTSSDVTDEILLIIERKLRETIGRTLHRDILEEIHEELYDLLTDWQDQLQPNPNSQEHH